MTNKNEDKAKELFHKYKDATMLGEPLSRGSVAFQSSLEMASWKDEQFQEERKQWIEKAINFLYENFYEHPHAVNHICTDIAENLNDLAEQFKQAIEE